MSCLMVGISLRNNSNSSELSRTTMTPGLGPSSSENCSSRKLTITPISTWEDC